MEKESDFFVDNLFAVIAIMILSILSMYTAEMGDLIINGIQLMIGLYVGMNDGEDAGFLSIVFWIMTFGMVYRVGGFVLVGLGIL